MEEILNDFNKIDNKIYYFNDLVKKYSLYSLMLVKDIDFMRCLLSYLIVSKRNILDTDVIGSRYDTEKALNLNSLVSPIDLYYQVDQYIDTNRLFVTRKDIIIKNNKNEIIFSKNLGKDTNVYLLMNKYLVVNRHNIEIYYKKNNKYEILTIGDDVTCIYQFDNFGIIITCYNHIYILTNTSECINKYILLDRYLITISNEEIIEYIRKI